MKSIITASALAFGIVGFASPSIALMNGHNAPEGYGTVYEMKMGDKMMHVQYIEDAQGGQWVVMSREEAESMGMKFDGRTATKLK